MVGYSSFDEEGKSKEITPVDNKTSLIKTYFPNGKTAVSYKLNSGIIDGEFQIFYSNGQLESSVTYFKGFKHGKSVKFYSNGDLHSEQYFHYDDLNGTQKYYYPNKKTKRTEEWVYGEKHGRTLIYDEDENLTDSLLYIGDVAYEIN